MVKTTSILLELESAFLSILELIGHIFHSLFFCFFSIIFIFLLVLHLLSFCKLLEFRLALKFIIFKEPVTTANERIFSGANRTISIGIILSLMHISTRCWTRF